MEIYYVVGVLFMSCCLNNSVRLVANHVAKHVTGTPGPQDMPSASPSAMGLDKTDENVRTATRKLQAVEVQ
jgi:hypothetical protein